MIKLVPEKLLNIEHSLDTKENVFHRKWLCLVATTHMMVPSDGGWWMVEAVVVGQVVVVDLRLNATAVLVILSSSSADLNNVFEERKNAFHQNQLIF